MSELKTDEERVEEIKRWWEKNGKFVIIVGIVVISTAVGTQVWRNFQLATVSKVSAQYDVLMQELSEGKAESVLQRGSEIVEKNADLPYAVYAALAMAKVHVEKGDNASAYDRLSWAMENSQDEEMKHIIRIRMAKVLISLDKLGEALAMASFPQQGKFSAQYSIVKGDIYQKQGEKGSAITAYRAALSDSNIGPQLKSLVQLKLEDLGGAEDGVAS